MPACPYHLLVISIPSSHILQSAGCGYGEYAAQSSCGKKAGQRRIVHFVFFLSIQRISIQLQYESPDSSHLSPFALLAGTGRPHGPLDKALYCRLRWWHIRAYAVLPSEGIGRVGDEVNAGHAVHGNVCVCRGTIGEMYAACKSSGGRRSQEKP
jgi:hypothetical protein